VGREKLVTVVLSGLANEVQYIRDQRNLTLETVCDQMGWAQSKLSRMENGQQCISTADLASLLVIYGVRGKDRQQLLHLVERQDEPGRWDFNSPLNAESKPLVRLEPQATSLVAAEPILIPGLIQTRDYTRAVLKASKVPLEQIEPRAKERSLRQLVLTKHNPPKLDMIVDEAALRRVFGSRKVMAKQLRVMAAAAERPNVRLWVLPFRTGEVGLFSSFYLMNFPRNKSVVYLETMASGIYHEDAEKIDYFRQQASELARVALNPAESGALVARIASEHDRE
jgi:transcriptional regulator with XRE-family HTH domain